MTVLSSAWERTREPLPCQYERGACIRCNKPTNTSFMWRCEVPFYGPGDLLFRISRFLDLRTCDPCHDRRKAINLLWYRLRRWVYAIPQHTEKQNTRGA